METNTFRHELLTNGNYEDWSAKMKNNLLAQGLWDIVETGSKPPKADDDVVEYEAWIKMNDAALRTIQSWCGMDILSRINIISSAKIVWIMLGKMFMECKGQDKLIQIEDYDLIIDKGNSSSLDSMESRGQDKLIQTEDVDSIIDEENSSSLDNMKNRGHDKLIETEDVDEENPASSNNTGQEREDDYPDLVKAVQRRDWITAIDFLKLHPAASTAIITVTGGTVLHAAVQAEQECIVEELVNMISEHDLAMLDDYDWTALHEATTSGNHRIAECLITKNKSLVSVRNIDGHLPVTMAMGFGHKELARYLYSQTPFEDLEAEQGRASAGARLLNGSIYTRDLDMALDLMERCPRLAFALDMNSVSPLRVLAVSTEAFESENRLVFWKRWIYNHLRADHLWSQLVSSLLNLFGFKRLYEMKLVRAQFQQLLSLMCEAIPTFTSLKEQYDIISLLIKLAISRGNFEFVCQILKANSSSLLSTCDATERRTLFQWAVVHRQHRIFSLAYNLKGKNYILYNIDNSKNTMLHLAGMLPKYSPIDHIRGAALQMQREVQWFKEVKRISPPSYIEFLNKDGLTASQLFMKEHQNMKKEAERWMKDMATSCTVVGALIITIMFAAAFTIPGGNDQNTGLPILIRDKLFTLFIVTDSVSLFASSTSVLMFSGIFISRFAEEDFLKSLPNKIIIGLFALFISIVTMMIAFSTALLLMLHGKYWIVIPIIGLAGVPIIIFVMMQFRFLIHMLVSTYGSSIFNRKMNPWF
ncbi:hypothetical protein I3843_14G042500 [Carya illinoinensis]|nr:hypothetical protein I3843_14G042500 [Carya illinoinensis]